MEFVSPAEEFDFYEGTLNWQELPAEQRSKIARCLLDYDEDTDVKKLVMKSELRKIQYEGLLTVIVRVGMAVIDIIGFDDTAGPEFKHYSILPYLEKTMLGQELLAACKGRGYGETAYRMGELEFLAQSGMRPSPLDALLDLRPALQLQGIMQLLNPVRTQSTPEPAVTKTIPDVPPKLEGISFQEAKKLHDEGRLRIYASYSGSLWAAQNNTVNTGFMGFVYLIGTFLSPIAGVIGAVFWAWWMLPLGIVGLVICFRRSRKSASRAVLKRAMADENFFDVMRDAKVISFDLLK